MNNLVDKFIKVCLAVIVLLTVITVNLDAAQAAPSTFQKTCSEISLNSVKTNPTLSAVCRQRNQIPHQTCLRLKGIENINGNLEQHSLNQPSTFQKSCRNISIDGAKLSASCRKRNQSYQNTSLYIPNIENIDGNLQYN